MRSYSEDEIAAEEQRIGVRLPEDLRRMYLDGEPEYVLLKSADGDEMDFHLWGPRATDTDTKGREYPTPGMSQETEEWREFLPADVVVAWGADGTGDLAVVLKDGSLAWWRHDAIEEDEEIVAVEVDWDP